MQFRTTQTGTERPKDRALPQTTGADARPFFFPRGETQLFGLYHAAAGASPRDCGVVLCYPTGHEYVRCHRGFRELAAHLARAGFPVLRFDYHGCGDSPGESDEADLLTWRADVAAAIAYMRTRSRCRSLCVVGLRLGANLALAAGAELGDVDRMVLWQPVVDGRAYLTGLRAQHAALVREHESDEDAAGRVPGDGGPKEILGFAFSEEALSEIAAIDLFATRGRPARHALLIDNTESGDDARVLEHVAGLVEDCDRIHVPEPRFWQAEPYEAVMPHETVAAIRSWMSEEAR